MTMNYLSLVTSSPIVKPFLILVQLFGMYLQNIYSDSLAKLSQGTEYSQCKVLTWKLYVLIKEDMILLQNKRLPQ